MVLAERGIQCMEREDMANASQLFEKVRRSQDLDAINQISIWCVEHGQLDMASQCLQFVPMASLHTYEHAMTLNNVGVVHVKKQQYDEAQSAFELAYAIFNELAKNDKSAVQQAAAACFNLGLVHKIKGRTYDAWDYWGKAAAGSNDVTILHYIATALVQDGQLADAKNLLLRMRELPTLSVEVLANIHNNLGVVTYRQANVQQAYIYFKAARRLGSEAGDENCRKLKDSFPKHVRNNAASCNPCLIL
jgi:tetratricopeptide (TPR) repeat protein